MTYNCQVINKLTPGRLELYQISCFIEQPSGFQERNNGLRELEFFIVHNKHACLLLQGRRHPYLPMRFTIQTFFKSNLEPRQSVSFWKNVQKQKDPWKIFSQHLTQHPPCSSLPETVCYPFICLPCQLLGCELIFTFWSPPTCKLALSHTLSDR